MTVEPGRGPERDLDLRLARFHLRAGLVALARAELEAAAGLGSLDREGLADLAEARWRTGDLLGAGLAAEAHLASGGDELVAHVIAAEARFAEGRRAEAEVAVEAAAARAAAAAAGAAAGAGPALLQALFAGLPASPIWDRVLGPPEGEAASAAVSTGAAGAPGRPTSEGVPAPAPVTAATRPDLGPSSAPLRASSGPAAAAAWLAAARAAVADGRLDEALTVLGLVLRREPAVAAAVLDVVAGLEGPAADLLRGDVLRLLGRAAEAEAAYQAAERALRRESTSEPGSTAPEPGSS